jgi:hypothetical protein
MAVADLLWPAAWCPAEGSDAVTWRFIDSESENVRSKVVPDYIEIVAGARHVSKINDGSNQRRFMPDRSCQDVA